MAGGRPTKYNDEILSTAEDYIVNYEEYGDVIPSIAGLACELGVSRETVHAWTKDDDKIEFSDIIKSLATAQERKLLNGGLKGGYNPMISKLILTKHGYSDKSEVDNRSSDGSLAHPGYKIVDE